MSKKTFYTKEDPRFNFMGLDDLNKEHLEIWVAEDQMEGLVDEESGGIIGYINRAHIDKLYTILNKMKHEEIERYKQH